MRLKLFILFSILFIETQAAAAVGFHGTSKSSRNNEPFWFDVLVGVVLLITAIIGTCIACICKKKCCNYDPERGERDSAYATVVPPNIQSMNSESKV